MRVTYRTKKIQKICTNASFASREFGEVMAQKIHQRIDEIIAIPTIHEMLKFRVGRCHSLTGNRKNQYAVDLVHPFRMVFTVDSNGDIQIANIEEIVDYH